MPYKSYADQLKWHRQWVKRNRNNPRLRALRRKSWLKWYLQGRDTEKFRASRLARTRKYRHSKDKIAKLEIQRKFDHDRKHPDRVVAYRAVRNAIRSGKLKRPVRCQDCGKRPKPRSDGLSGMHAHHSNYAKPLKVRWLCAFCHARKNRKYK